MDLANKVALITGGASGLGFEYAKELLRNGVKHVAIADLAKSGGEISAEKLNVEFGKRRAIFIACDVTKASEFEAAFGKTIKDLGGVDIVINNAGILNESRWELTVDVNLNGVIHGTFLALKFMGKDKGGKGGILVNIASIFGLDPIAWLPIYVATKHAVLGLSRSFGTPYHYEKTGVQVVTMCPGITDTQLVADAPLNISNFVDTEVAMADIKTYPFQKPENVAQGMIHVIKSANNGSVWVAEGENPAVEIFIPDRFTLIASSN